jgi:hypothetical protein
LANIVDMVGKIAECCDDGALRRLVLNTPEYAELVDDDVSYHGKEGRKRWDELGDVIHDTWERAITRVDQWLSWQGDFSNTDLEAETIWDRIGAEPIEIVLADAVYLTVRGYIDDTAVFLGSDGNVEVFTDVADLARFCRTAEEHDLTKLEWWAELADEDEDSVFTAGLDASYDLTRQTTKSAELVRELVAYCELQAEAEELEDPIDEGVWDELITEIETCLEPQD